MALATQRQLARALNPAAALSRGYALIRNDRGVIIRRASQLKPDDIVRISMADAEIAATVNGISRNSKVDKTTEIEHDGRGHDAKN